MFELANSTPHNSRTLSCQTYPVTLRTLHGCICVVKNLDAANALARGCDDPRFVLQSHILVHPLVKNVRR